jgi:hypothetical protein
VDPAAVVDTRADDGGGVRTALASFISPESTLAFVCNERPTAAAGGSDSSRSGGGGGTSSTESLGTCGHGRGGGGGCSGTLPVGSDTEDDGDVGAASE